MDSLGSLPSRVSPSSPSLGFSPSTFSGVQRSTKPTRTAFCNELPPVNMFVTTADTVLEQPIITVNTVLSLLAVDYSANKLACYVSNDGCSPLTFYSLVEASKFSKLWVPCCKKYSIRIRAPFRYFANESKLSGDNSSEFREEWKRMKEEYDRLSQKIEEAVRKSVPCDLTGEFAVFSNIERNNHPSIIKVIWESKENLPDGLPHLVYISREKRPKHPHYYKAGAMNVLVNCSFKPKKTLIRFHIITKHPHYHIAAMTNAPFMLNIDCDMFAKNPQIVLHAMCVLLGVENEREFAFVHFLIDVYQTILHAWYDGDPRTFLSRNKLCS